MRVLVLGNGSGEDAIGAAIARELIGRGRDAGVDVDVDAWAMVGEGRAFDGLPVTRVGEPSRPPSAGFGTLQARAFARDLAAGLVGSYARQARWARGARGRYDACVATGDVVPLAAALLTRSPVTFVGSAKSAYLTGPFGYNRLEEALIDRCAGFVPRDGATAEAFRARGTPITCVGNGLLDALGDARRPLPFRVTGPVVLYLPGSRADAPERLRELLGVRAAVGEPAHHVFAMAGSVPEEAIRGLLEEQGYPGSPAIGSPGPPVPPRAHFVWGRLAELSAVATVAVGPLASAAQQVAARGVPVVTFESRGLCGLYGPRHARVNEELFGEACLFVRGGSAGRERAGRERAGRERVGREVAALLRDGPRRERMGRAGRERMGSPGVARAVAEAVLRAGAGCPPEAAR